MQKRSVEMRAGEGDIKLEWSKPIPDINGIVDKLMAAAKDPGSSVILPRQEVSFENFH